MRQNQLQHIVFNPWHRKVLELIDRELHKNALRNIKIADIGCDEGIVLFRLAEKYKNKIELYGIDFRKEVIQNAIKMAKELDFKNVDLEYGYFLDKPIDKKRKFDIVIFSEVYEHLIAENQIKSLRVIGTILKDYGTLVMITPNGDYIFSNERKKNFEKKYDKNFFKDVTQTLHWLEPKKDELRRLLISLGYDIDRINYFNLPLSGSIKVVGKISIVLEKIKYPIPFLKYFWKQIFVVARKNPKSPLLNDLTL